MSLLHHALRGGLAPATPRAAGPRPGVVVAGAAGPLGSEVLERLLSGSGLASLAALVVRPLEVALAGLQAWPVHLAFDDPALDTPPRLPAGTDTAVVVFDRQRHHHGREAAFFRPQPARLAALAGWLHAAGVQRLVLVLPHAPALLPAAVRAGLASLDEQAVAALGFDQLLIVRPARLGSDPATGGQPLLARVARGLLAQLHWMVPQREQPLRAAKVGELVAALVRGLPGAPAGTRVLGPEKLWDWAQPGGGAPWLQAWLAGHTPPPVALPARRW